MRRDFCVYFDHRYFDRGVAMHDSLMHYCPGARLFVLCLSDACHDALTRLALPGLVPIRLVDFEAGNAALAAAKANRSLIEYYFTCTASLLDWLFETHPEIEVLTYLDGDLYFFSDPSPIFAAFENYSSLIVGHRFPPQLKALEVYGIHNVGWLTFRRDADGLACLRWWRDRCLEWCYDRLEGDRFADQKYLDRFTELFNRVLVLDHPGVNLAPWNMGRHRMSEQGGKLLADGREVIFFHFHNFKPLGRFAWRIHHRDNAIPRYPFLARLLYRPYIRALARAHALGVSVGLAQEKTLSRQAPGRRKLRNLLRILYYREFVLSGL
jgi:hypothetical protein